MTDGMPEGLAGGPVVGEDGVARCPWAGDDPLNRAYHDTEWGIPVHGEAALLERITLEAFQSGLSWLTILRKRPGFRAAFEGFDAEVVAAFTDHDVERLMTDTAIVRNRAKILAARGNARATVALRAHGGLDARIWSHLPGRTHAAGGADAGAVAVDTGAAAPRILADLRAETPASRALAKDLKSNGFVFVGPTTSWALMQAIGLVDDHLVGCFRRGATGDHRAG